MTNCFVPNALRSAVAATVAVLAFPAVAFGADAAGSKVLRIDPSTGARKVLASSVDWNALPGIAVGPSGTVYVAAEGRRPGMFSLTAPGFAIAQLAKTSRTDPHAWRSPARRCTRSSPPAW